MKGQAEPRGGIAAPGIGPKPLEQMGGLMQGQVADGKAVFHGRGQSVDVKKKTVAKTTVVLG